MYDLPVSCSLVNAGQHMIIDPVPREENNQNDPDFAKVSIAMMPAYNNQVIYMNSIGCLKPQFLTSALKTLRSKCQIILAHIKNHLKSYIRKAKELSDSEDVDVETDHIKASELKLFQPQKYMNAHLENNIRPDGRALDEFRSVLLTVGSVATAEGSALVRLNNTSVLCGIKAYFARPTPEHPKNGYIVPSVTLTPVCSNKFQPGAPGEQAQAYSRLIMDLLTDSSVIDHSLLCLEEGKFCWCLSAEMVCLSHDGNILDACLLALMAALRTTKLPEVKFQEESDVPEINESAFVSLNMNCSMFPATFALLDNVALADPTEEEENLASGTLSVFVKDDDSVSVNSFGAVKEDSIFSSIKCARARYREMKSLIETLN